MTWFPASLMHWECNYSGEGRGGDVGEAMLQQKVRTWTPTKRANYCPLKPRQWLQRENAYFRTLKKEE
eukprot:1680784-Ditylum_brightwellii.AAC.1